MVLSETAHAALQRALLQRLCDQCGPALCEGFMLFGMMEQSPAMSFGLMVAGDPTSRERYDRYLTVLRQEDLRNCFTNRPVLARLVARVTELWMATTAELIKRLHADLPVISETFHGGKPIKAVSDVRCSLSDPHNGGRTVFHLTFANGFSVGYKPKDLGLDVAWHGLLEWLEKRGAPPSAQAPDVIDRSGYGWVEWIEHGSCADADEARTFFERAGAMLCLFRVLQGTDFHYENVIAAGSRPAPIDLETLMHPQFSTAESRAGVHPALATAAQRLRGSVLATMYLPHWVVSPGGKVAGIGGLNPVGAQTLKIWGARDINSDAMAYGYIDTPKDRTSHAPSMSGEPLSSEDYREDIARGYEEMYRFLLREKVTLLSDGNPLAAFRNKVARAVLRPTQLYGALIHRSIKGQSLGDGVGWSLQFDFLKRLVSDDDETDKTRAQQRAERRALQDLDIPFATVLTDGLDLNVCGTLVEEYCERSSYDRLTETINGLSEEDLGRELLIIAQTLEPHEAAADRRHVTPWSPSDPSGNDTLTVETAIAKANEIAALLDREAVRENGGAAWVGAVPLVDEENTQLDIVGYDLYAGNGGIALFLAALHRVTGNGSYRDLALAAFEPFHVDLATAESRERIARIMGVGGGTGIGSVIYSLVRTATLMDEPTLLDDALAAADLISQERIDADRHFDVLTGSAGAILGLLALHEMRPDDRALQPAIACGRHLLEAQRPSEAGGGAWHTLSNRQLTGFSHGAAGIVLALMRLYDRTGDTAFRDAARDGLAYETATFSSTEKNWPDFREFGDEPTNIPRYPIQWCHGAAGIGLARIGCLGVCDDDPIRTDIDVAIESTSDMPIASVDHLCCGNFGRLEVLFSAGQHLDSETMTMMARQRAAQLLSRAEKAGSFGWLAGTDKFNPGFFTGVSGVGYELLRFTIQRSCRPY